MSEHITSIVGSSFYKGAKQWLENLPSGSPVTISRDTRNDYDENAIAVFVQGKKVGHIKRDDAALLAPIMDRGVEMLAHLHPIAPVIIVTWQEELTFGEVIDREGEKGYIPQEERS
jgi:hypothetical protein